MSSFLGRASVTFADLAGRDGYAVRKGTAFPQAAGDLSGASGGDIDSAAPDAFDGCFHGNAQAVIADCGLKSGAAVTGSPIVPTSTPPWKSPRTGAKGVYWADGRANATFGGTLNMSQNKDSSLLVIERGLCAPTVTPTPANFYTDIYFRDPTPGSVFPNWRLRLAAHKPASLHQTDDGTNWRVVDVCGSIPDSEAFLQAHGRRLILQVRPQWGNDGPDTLRLILNNNYQMRVSPTDVDNLPISLPDLGPFRVEGQNGYAAVERYALRFGAINIKKTVPIQEALPGGVVPSLSLNGRGDPNSGQTDTVTLTPNGGGDAYLMEVQSSLTDAGEGKGSQLPPVVGDVTFHIPFAWNTSGIPGDLSPFATQVLTPIRAEITEVLDDSSRTRWAMATLYFNNRSGYFNGGLPHVAVDISIGRTGGSLVAQFTGIGGVGESGVQVMSHAGRHIAVVHCECACFKMKLPGASARQYDGWSLPDMVAWEAQHGGIHPKYLTSLPAAWNPYGTAAEGGSGCPYYIMARGTGLTPAQEYLANTPPWEVLQRAAKETGDSDGPNYMGIHQPDGQFQFGSYNPATDTVADFFTEDDMRHLVVTNSIANLRTAIDLQTINPLTYELETAHIDMPLSIQKRVGFVREWLERSARFGGNLSEIAGIAEHVASLNDQVAHFTTNLVPGLHVAQKATIQARELGGSGVADMYCVHVNHVVGAANPWYPGGDQVQETHATYRKIDYGLTLGGDLLTLGGQTLTLGG